MGIFLISCRKRKYLPSGESNPGLPGDRRETGGEHYTTEDICIGKGLENQ